MMALPSISKTIVTQNLGCYQGEEIFLLREFLKNVRIVLYSILRHLQNNLAILNGYQWSYVWPKTLGITVYELQHVGI